VRRSVPRSPGFTLIEVLVALAIVVLGMAAVMGALTSSADTIVYMRDKTFAQWVALNQITTLRLSGQPPPTGGSDGDAQFAGRTWHWHQEVVKTEIPGSERIDVSVRPADSPGAADDKDKGWLTTVSGISADALVSFTRTPVEWGWQQIPGQQSGLGTPLIAPQVGLQPAPGTPQPPPPPQPPQEPQ